MTTLNKKIAFNGTMAILTGIHVGDSKENVQIGGVDAPVVRRKDNNQPYIPGSSLKGKIRCLLEQTKGSPEIGDSDVVNMLFGITENKKGRANIPSKLIVRDAYLTKESVELLEKSDFTDFPFTEVKFENTIDRIKGSAGNPRKIERVPVGAKFDVEFVINVWDTDTQQSLIDLLKQGINLLEADYLGGSGSRGYGQVKFDIDFANPTTLFENQKTPVNV